MKIIVTLVVFISLAAAGQTPPPMHFSDPQVQSNYEAALARVARPIPPPQILVPGSPWRTNVVSDLPPYTAAYTQTNLSAHITAATNRVSTLRDLEFTVVITNIATTDVIINPWILINGLGTIEVFNTQGMMVVQLPHPHFISPTSRPQIDTTTPNERVLTPGEIFTFTYKLSVGDYFNVIPGKYRAREGLISSNEFEITIE